MFVHIFICHYPYFLKDRLSSLIVVLVNSANDTVTRYLYPEILRYRI